MKIPKAPPSYPELERRMLSDATDHQRVLQLLRYRPGASHERYLAWDQLRRRTPPAGLTHEEWWFTVKNARLAMQRPTGLRDASGRDFTYALPDEVLKETDFIGTYASGRIATSEAVTNPATRDRYLVSSLIEEAITSSQLEGAATERRVAKDMIRSGRRPRDKSEKMIFNNYEAMREVGSLKDEPLTPDLIRHIHRIVTDETLEDPTAAGRFQEPHEDRVGVWDVDGNVLHTPPDAALLPERIEALCAFANDEDPAAYMPGVLKALAIHFMLAYEHPFEDGNGRTARVLFYWSMLRQGYWMTEYLSVSRILRAAPAKYARSFLYSELDDNDLTYFFSYHLRVIHRAIDDLHDYLGRKVGEIQQMRRRLAGSVSLFNNRQVALLQHAVANPGRIYTVHSHQVAHRTSLQTARTDLSALVEYGLMTAARVGKQYEYTPVADLTTAIDEVRTKDRAR